MIIKALGDSAWLVEFPGLSGELALARVMGWVKALASDRPSGVLDVVPSFSSFAVHFEGVGGHEILDWLRSVKIVDEIPQGRDWEIPVAYGGDFGPDLGEVARWLNLSEAEVIARHHRAVYTVAAVGFSPGFPYLLGLPESLYLPRRETPRTAVPAGSVAIAGGQAGIYPSASPGGWHVLGRTAVKLFDAFDSRGELLGVGDRVRFVPVDHLDENAFTSSEISVKGNRWVEVISPGALTSVQDLGRPGHEAAGVSPGGALDREALRMANLLVGNAPNAAGLEICLKGPILQFNVDTVISVVGATGRSREVKAGELVDLSGSGSDVRKYLAVAGGFMVPKVLGSSATDVRGGFGGFLGRNLMVGDRLELGEPGAIPQCGDWSVGRVATPRVIELRFLAGVQDDWFSENARWRFRHEIYRVTPNGNRMGMRLDGPALELDVAREMASQPVVCGSVQVPPDGKPIVLLAERQTIGGYPQIGHVISADLPRMARAWPGTAVRFTEISWDEAQEIRAQEKQNLNRLQVGLKLLT